MTADDILHVPAGSSTDTLEDVILEWAASNPATSQDPQHVLAYIKWEIDRRLTGDTRRAVFAKDGPVYL